MIIWDLHSRDNVTVGKADYQSQLYTFSHFSFVVPSTNIHTQASSVNTFEEIQYGQVNFGILSTGVQETFTNIASPTLTVVPDDSSIAMALIDSVQQDIHCLPNIHLWDEY